MMNLEETRALIGSCIVFNVWIYYPDAILAVTGIKRFQVKVPGGHSFSMYVKFSKKLIISYTLSLAHVRVRIRGVRNISFSENSCKY